MNNRFHERLATGPIVVGDGGMGVLISSAVPRLRCPEEANIRSPESVVTLHASFIRAGADLIETNTFGANRRKLAHQYLEEEFERINGAAVKLAPITELDFEMVETLIFEGLLALQSHRLAL